MAAVLIVAVGWPSVAGATTRAPPEAPAIVEEPEPLAEPSTTPKVELTPEEIERRRLELKLEQAMLHWQEGDRLYYNHRYAEAAVEFERSYAGWPVPDALYSMGLSYARAGKPVEAMRSFERYLALPDCEDRPLEERTTTECPTLRAEAKQVLAEQRSRVGELVLTLGEGVKLREVRVAGQVVPLEDFPHLLVPGTVDVEVFGLGPKERRSRPVSITGGQQTVFYVAPFEIEPTTGTPPKTDPGNKPDLLRLERRQRALKTGFYVGTGLTAASGTAMAVMGALTLYHHRHFNSEKCPAECWEKNADGTPKRDAEGNIEYLHRPYPSDHKAKFTRYLPVTNALVGVTVGLAVVTALVGTFAFRKRAGQGPRTLEASGRVGVRGRVRVGASGLVVRW
jgi:hypothetical protein